MSALGFPQNTESSQARLTTGAFVRVRHRRWLVEEVEQPPQPNESRLVTLSCIDDDAVGTSLTVLWDIEPDASVIAESGWQSAGAGDFDPPDGHVPAGGVGPDCRK